MIFVKPKKCRIESHFEEMCMVCKYLPHFCFHLETVFQRKIDQKQNKKTEESEQKLSKY